MYCDTCRRTRRTDTLDFVCFLYASLSHISKVETVKRTLLQTDNFFQSSSNLPDTKKKFINSEKQRIELNIFVKFLKKRLFLPLKTTMIIFDFTLQFSGSVSCSLQPTNSCFASRKMISDRDL